MKNSFCHLIGLCFVLFLIVCNGAVSANDRSLYQKALAHYDLLLQASVKNAKVDYNHLIKNQDTLDHYMYAVNHVNYENLQRNEKIALLVNAYNAFTLRLIMDYWPKIRSIKEIPEFPLARRWKDKRWMLAGKRVSLNDIKQQYLRRLQIPITHMVLVCATKSCPDLKSNAFRAGIINKELKEAAQLFLSQPKGLTWKMQKQLFGEDKPTLYVSSIFKWEEDDFLANGFSIVSFVEEYAPLEAKNFIKKYRDNLQVKYLSYDWSLNKL